MSKLLKLALFAALAAAVILGVAGTASMSGLHLTPQGATPPSVPADPKPLETSLPPGEFQQQFSQDGGTAQIFEYEQASDEPLPPCVPPTGGGQFICVEEAK